VSTLARLVVDLQDPQTLYWDLGGFSTPLYVSKNQGRSWTTPGDNRGR